MKRAYSDDVPTATCETQNNQKYMSEVSFITSFYSQLPVYSPNDSAEKTNKICLMETFFNPMRCQTSAKIVARREK